MMTKPRFLLAVLAAIMITALVSHGRVFFRWGAAAQSLHALEALGGTLAYQAPVTLNSGKGQLTVFEFQKPIAEVVRALTHAFAMTGYHYAGGTLGYGSVSANGQTHTLVVIQLGDDRRTILFQVEQSDEDSRRSAAPPAGQMLAGVPGYPDSEPVFFASDETAGISVAISRTHTGEEEARQTMDIALSSAGWQPAFRSANGTVAAPRLRIYLKQQQICCVLVDASEKQGESRITMLHKQRGMK